MTPREDEPDVHELSRIAALADGSLEPKRRAELEARVAASPELADRLAEQQRAVALVRNAAVEIEAPAPLRTRIEAQRHPRRTVAPRGFVLIGAAATAMSVVALAVGLAVFGSGTSDESYRAALGATALAPGATGQATFTKTSSGWRIDLHATGLPRLADGRFYEAWLRNSAGALVPVGTFNEGRYVTLWAGVSPSDYRTLTVTRESADGDQASSGQRVLVGTANRDG
jgi:hypothetical protein